MGMLPITKNQIFMEISKLIDRGTQLLTEAGYTSSRIYTYKWLWKKGILVYMSEKDQVDYDEKLGNDFILTCQVGGNVTFHHRDLIKSIDVLNNVLVQDNIGGRRSFEVKYPLNGKIGEETTKYITSLKDLRRNKKTIQSYLKILSNFIENMIEQGICAPSEITEDAIVRYVENRTYRQYEYIAKVHRFLLFLFQNEIIATDFSYILNKLGKLINRTRIPSFYSEMEVRKVEQSLSRSSNVGKRDYAIILLSSRLGMRVSDIAQLTFDNIDWENNNINFLQYKTGNPNTLPLLPAVGNAIIDYLRNGRPKIDSDQVFVSCKAPYKDLDGGAVHSIIARAFSLSGININERHHGGHALRFSLAQRMLEKSMPIPIISETLGHTVLDTTRSYVRIDLSHMQQCVLAIPEVKEEFYLQKGGCFYD